MGSADIPLSLGRGVSPRRCSWKLLTDGVGVFPGSESIIEARTLDEELGTAPS